MPPISTSALYLEGPAGKLEAVLSNCSEATPLRGLVAHPHPLYGGSMDNLVVLEAVAALGRVEVEALRFNFRGVGRSAGNHDSGRGEVLDLKAAMDFLHDREPHLPTLLVGYSFGAAMTLAHLKEDDPSARRLVGVLLLAPPLTHYDFSALERCDLPVAVLYGESDALTPAGLVESSLGGRLDELTRCESLPAASHDLGTSTGDPALAKALDSSLAWLIERSITR